MCSGSSCFARSKRLCQPLLHDRSLQVHVSDRTASQAVADRHSLVQTAVLMMTMHADLLVNCTSPPCTAVLDSTHQAVLINAASGMNNGMAVPSGLQGHGRINLSSTLPLGSTAFSMFTYEGKIATSITQSFVFTVTSSVSSTSQAELTLVWTDPPATVLSANQGENVMIPSVSYYGVGIAHDHL